MPIESWLATNKEDFFLSIGDSSSPWPYIDTVALAASYDRMIEIDPNILWRAMTVCLRWKRCMLGEALPGR